MLAFYLFFFGYFWFIQFYMLSLEIENREN